jgi:hypothetical protein
MLRPRPAAEARLLTIDMEPMRESVGDVALL